MAGRVLILTDGKAGHENQSKAFARSLGCEADVVEIRFRSAVAKALSYLLDHVGVRTLALFSPLPPGTIPERTDMPCGYSAVIGTGSGTFYAAKAVAKKLGVKCGVVLYPRGYELSSFGAILAPAFDNPPHAPNIVEIPANLVANDDAFYEKGVADFRSRHVPGDKPAYAVIIGGPNKCSTMTAEWTKGVLDGIFADTPDCEHWVTTSRRTPPDVEALVDSYPWDYKLIYSKDHFNPIPAFVRLARRLYVTAESTGMLSEACMCGSAEVFALDNLSPGPHKFRRFVENLRAGGYVEGSRKVDLRPQFDAAKALLEIP